MKKFHPKKSLGQHFLLDLGIAEDIADALTGHMGYTTALEVGPGKGVLTDFLVPKKQFNLHLVEMDDNFAKNLPINYPSLAGKIYHEDFLQLDLQKEFTEKFGVIGNFPYNISSQIFFKILEIKDQVPEVVGMLQKEVAQRITAKPGNKTYGILSVLLGAYYDTEYLFDVGPEKFNPPPKVQSGVIRVTRNTVAKLDCDEVLFKRVVKQGFQTRRKTLRNALKSLDLPEEIRVLPILDKRAEQLSVDDFVKLTQKIQA